MVIHSGMITNTRDGRNCSSKWPRSAPAHDCTNFFSSTLKLIGDNGVVLYHRVNVEGYQECQGDILAVSGMAEDIRDALLEYQVSSSKFHALVGH